MCNKKKYDYIGALFALSQCKKHGKYNPLRNEIRIYFCNRCKSYHLTSEVKKHEK